MDMVTSALTAVSFIKDSKLSECCPLAVRLQAPVSVPALGRACVYQRPVFTGAGEGASAGFGCAGNLELSSVN